MIVYRITNMEHEALNGNGGLFGSGRCHRKGDLVVYTSEHTSLSAWDKIVHVTSFENLHKNPLLIKIWIRNKMEIQTVPQCFGKWLE